MSQGANRFTVELYSTQGKGIFKEDVQTIWAIRDKNNDKIVAFCGINYGAECAAKHIALALNERERAAGDFSLEDLPV